MKRGTTSHPKTLDLAERLGLELWGAVGILESLWLFAGQHARRGDIGRHTDAGIARAIGWRGEPAKLIAALTACRWVDGCSCHRIRVHDWPDHADQAVQKTQEVVRHGFLECYRDIRPLEDVQHKDSGPPAEVYPPPALVKAQGKGTGKARGSPEGDGKQSDVKRVFGHWRQVMEHPDAKLTPERQKRIEQRLREGYSVEALFEAIDGCAASPFHRGDNDRHTVYDDLMLIFRNGSKVEQFRELRKAPPSIVPARASPTKPTVGDRAMASAAAFLKQGEG